jgi:CubicO group peptidase (beta-lactamase class C family)
MKRILLALTIVVGCTSPDTNKNKHTDGDVTAVENNLIADVHFEDDSLWNIEQRMKFYGVPGVSIAVIKDNKIAWTKAYGIMDKETNEPVTTTTLFQAGSISKPVAAYGALKMVEMGKLDLNTDVNKYLTSWKIPDSEFTKEKKVTLEHLVSHTGGLTVHGFWGYPEPPVPTLLQVLDGTPPANSDPIRVDKAPETGFRYSGGGYCVMQQMMIDLYGKPFPEIEKELVLGPLDMNNSTYDQPLDAEMVKKAATGYLPNHEQTKNKRHVYPEMAAAGLWTTAEDLAKFAIDIQLTLKGESSKVLSKEMATRMTTPVKNEKSIGLGIFMNDRKGEIYFGHGGWDEGFSSDMVAHREKGYGVVVLTNSNHPQFISELIRSVARVYNWDNYTTNYKKLPLDASSFGSITGRYRNGSDDTFTITSKGDRLYIKWVRAVEPSELFKISDSTYISRSDGNPVRLDQRMKDDEKVPYEYLLAGDYRKALDEYQKSIKVNPTDWRLSEQRMTGNAFDLAYMHKKKEGRELMLIVMKLYPNSEQAKKNLQELENIPE